MRRRAWAVCAFLLLLVAAGVYVLIRYDIPYELGISDARFNGLPIGTSRDRMCEVLGSPDQRHTRAEEGAKLVQYVRPCAGGGYEPHIAHWDEWHDDMRKRADEVWIWQKGLRVICAVFDRDGKLIFKYVDA